MRWLSVSEDNSFGIWTNDLTQYTLAIDRQNRKLEQFYDSHHPAVLRMIDLVITAAHAQGKWVGICGELASDSKKEPLYDLILHYATEYKLSAIRGV